MTDNREGVKTPVQKLLDQQQASLLKNNRDGIDREAVKNARKDIENAIGIQETRIDKSGSPQSRKVMREASEIHADRLMRELKIDDPNFKARLIENLYDRRGGEFFSGTNVLSTDEILLALDDTTEEFYPGAHSFIAMYAANYINKAPNPETEAIIRNDQRQLLVDEKAQIEQQIREGRLYHNVSNWQIEIAETVISNAATNGAFKVDLKHAAWADLSEADTQMVRYRTNQLADHLCNTFGIEDQEFKDILARNLFNRGDGGTFSWTNEVTADEIKSALDSAARERYKDNPDYKVEDFTHHFGFLLQEKNKEHGTLPLDEAPLREINARIEAFDAEAPQAEATGSYTAPAYAARNSIGFSGG